MGTDMETKELTRRELEQKADRLWNCYNGLWTSFRDLTETITKTQVANWIFEALDKDSNFAINAKRGYFKEAEEALTKIEDAIKRYREGRKQTYEEAPRG